MLLLKISYIFVDFYIFVLHQLLKNQPRLLGHVQDLQRQSPILQLHGTQLLVQSGGRRGP